MDRVPSLPPDFNPPEQWRELEQGNLRGTVMIVGATDTGKSTLARWLFQKACDRGQTAAWLDGDLGQSSLGIPGTLNLVIGTAGSSKALARAAFFVGSSSPKGHMLQVLTGLCRLHGFARSGGADPIFVDTSGLVAREAGGGALKEWEAELLMPDAVIALQRERELEHLLGPWRHDPRLHLHLLSVAGGARKRPPEERAERRQHLFRRFFEKAGTLRIYKGRKPIYGLKGAEPGRLAGLMDRKGLLLGTGAVKRVLPNGLELVSPCPSPEQAALVRLGKLRIDPVTGAELHRVPNPAWESEAEE